MVQMHVTGPQHQQGPALSSWAQRRISLLIATDLRCAEAWHGVTVQTV